MWDYCNELIKSNSDSSVLMFVDRPSLEFPSIFERLYVCLSACKQRFLVGCRILIGLNGYHLKGYCDGGTLLAVIAQDGNNSFYVIVYVIIDLESKDIWGWFLSRLQENIEDAKQSNYEFISD